MFDQEFLENNESLPNDLASEIDVVLWPELARHFAFGRLYVVRKPWTLLEAANVIKGDDAARLKSAMDNGEFAAPTVDEAQVWHEQRRSFDVLVLDPFVIVSPKE
ncbi:MAG: DUF2288 family protein [Bdellovibrionota bacterium]